MRETFEVNAIRVNIREGGQRLMRVALVADLHNRPCERLLTALAQEESDLICVAGDLMECYAPDDLAAKLADLDTQSERYPKWKRAIYRQLVRMDALLDRRKQQRFDEKNENAFAFLRAAAQLAPTFYAPGNHERFMTDAARREVRETGATLLDNDQARAIVRGCETLIGGLGAPRDMSWLERFAATKTDGVKLLICHHPEYYDWFLRDKDVGIVLCGHAHGGQWRILGKPLFAPGQGLFPKHADGLYENRLVVSRGLSNTANVPRLGNPMELVIVEAWG